MRLLKIAALLLALFLVQVAYTHFARTAAAIRKSLRSTSRHGRAPKSVPMAAGTCGSLQE